MTVMGISQAFTPVPIPSPIPARPYCAPFYASDWGINYDQGTPSAIVPYQVSSTGLITRHDENTIRFEDISTDLFLIFGSGGWNPTALNQNQIILPVRRGNNTTSGVMIITRFGNTISGTDLQLPTPAAGNPPAQFLIRLDDTHFMRGASTGPQICAVNGTTASIISSTSLPVGSGFSYPIHHLADTTHVLSLGLGQVFPFTIGGGVGPAIFVSGSGLVAIHGRNQDTGAGHQILFGGGFPNNEVYPGVWDGATTVTIGPLLTLPASWNGGFGTSTSWLIGKVERDPEACYMGGSWSDQYCFIWVDNGVIMKQTFRQSGASLAFTSQPTVVLDNVAFLGGGAPAQHLVGNVQVGVTMATLNDPQRHRILVGVPF